MFKTKKDVDRHVRTALAKLRSDNEKNIRGFTIAKLYYKINEFATAQHYIAGYLSVKEECAAAHKLLGQCLVQLKKPDKALVSFQRSLHLDQKQPDLLIQVCKLIVSDELSSNINKAKYWCDLAESENVQHDSVFSLRLKLLNKNNLETNEVEEMILKEIANRPTDPNLRVRIVKHFIEQNKIPEAFKYAYDLEMKNHSVFSNCIDWYNIIWLVLTKYKQQPNVKKTWEYWLLLMICIERQVDLSFVNFNNNLLSSGGTTEISNLLFTFDQQLFEASQCVTDLSPERELGVQFLYHFRGQLCLHAAALVYRREQVQNKNQWREATKNALPLLLFAFHCSTPDTKESWLKHSGEKSRQLIQIWHREGSFRCAQAGRTLLSCIDNSRDETLTSQVQNVMSDHSIWSSVDDILAQIRQYCSDNGWRTKLFRLLFPSSDQLVKLQSSHFVNCEQFAEPTFELPKHSDIETYEEIAQYLRPQSLQHMVYLCMGIENLHDVRCKYFNGLHFSTQNLAFCGAESLNQLDIETFLYATVIQAKRLYDVERFQYENYNAKNVGKPGIMPFANMSSNLCTEEQSNWWLAAYQVYKNLTGDNLAELRATLQYGIEAVRGVNGPKIDLIVVLQLGKLFVTRSQDSTKSAEKAFLEARIQTLYKYGLTMLKLHSKGVLEPFRKLFKYNNANTASVERDITNLAEEAVTLIAARHFKNADYEECIEELAGIQLPYATYFQAEAYRKLDESNKTPKKTKKLYSDKAKDCLNQTLNLLGFLNQSHPLNSVVHSEIKRMQYTDMFLNETQSNEHEEFLNESFNANRSRREAQNASISTAKTTELENLIKQMLNTLSFVKEELVEKMKPEVSEIKKDLSILKEKMSTIEETIKKRSEPPSRDDATNVLDDLYIIGDELQPGMFSGYNQTTQQQQQRMQTPNALLNQPPIHHTQHNPAPLPATNLYNSPLYNQIVGSPANPLLNQQSHHTPQFTTPAPNMYNAPLYNPNYPFNYYPQLVMPPGPLNFGLQTQQQPQQIMPTQTDNSPSLYELINQSNTIAAVAQNIEKPMEKPITQPSTSVSAMWNRMYNNAPVEKGPPVNVVITSSDPLPAHTTISTQSTLSVTIPPQHIKPSLVANDVLPISQQPSNTSFSMLPENLSFGMNTLAATASKPSITSTISFAPPKVDADLSTGNIVNESIESDQNKSAEVEYDPRPDFKPIIPLPDEVEVRTGEENEDVLFCSRAKLLRLIEKEWKERGIGDMKILKNKSDGKIRILMRREQTHKICANHNITSEMKLIQASSDPKSYIWCANDFADEVLMVEKLCVRFKLVETGKEFYSVFTKVQADLKANDSSVSVEKKSDAKKKEKSTVEPFGLAKSTTFNFGKTSTPISKTAAAASKSEIPTSSPFLPKQANNNELVKETKAQEPAKVSPFSNFSFSATTVVGKDLPFSTAAAPKDSPFSTTVATKDSPFSNIFSNTEFKTPPLWQPVVAAAATSTPQQNPVPNNELNKSEADEDDYVPTAQFKPVISLPDLVEVQTGEENEKVLFEHRAKLLRFDKPTSEWKERGIGIIKVLVDANDANRVRLVMRREQILKLCCNQRLTKNIIFKNPPSSKSALTWCGQDFSENELQTEVFTIRFKTADICNNFHDTVLKAQANMADESEGELEPAKSANGEPKKSQPFAFGTTKENKENVVSSTTEGFGDKFKAKPGSWACDGCYTVNNANVLYCIACDHPKDDTVPKKPAKDIFSTSNNKTTKSAFTFGFGAVADAPKLTTEIAKPDVGFGDKTTEGFGDKFKAKPGSWSCDGCYTVNNANVLYCIACDQPKDDTIPKKPPKDIFSTPNNKTTKSTFTFGFGAAPDASKLTTEIAKPDVGFGDKFKPKADSWECKECYVSNEGAALYCNACESPVNSTVEPKPKNLFASNAPSNFSFGFTPPAVDLSKSSDDSKAAAVTVANAAAPKQQTTSGTQSFQFGSSGGFAFTKSTTTESSAFGADSSAVPFTFSLNNTTTPSSMFGVSTETTDSKTSTTAPPKPVFGLNQKASTVDCKTENGFMPEKMDFKFSMKPKSPGKLKSPQRSTGGADDESDAEDIEEENNTYFAPVIPLPDKVDVVTGEENEEQLYCHRAKLYRYASGEWKERGIGDVKILRHTETKKLRVVMRREQVLKICLNHALTNEVDYSPKDEKSWHFVANDFSEGEIQSMVFSLRFKNKEIANDFMAAIYRALEEQPAIAPLAEPKDLVPPVDSTDRNNKTESNLPDEVKKLADRIQLPYSFFEYNKAEPCPGCRGCDPDKFSFSPCPNITPDAEEPPIPLAMPHLTLSTPNKTILKQSILSTPTFSPKPENNNGVKNIFGGGANLFTTPNGTDSIPRTSESAVSASESSFVFSLGDSTMPKAQAAEKENSFTSGGFLFGNSKTKFGNADNARPVFGQTSIFGNANIAPSAPTLFGNSTTPATDTKNTALITKPKEGEPLFGSKSTFSFGSSGFGTTFGSTTSSNIFGGGATTFGATSNTDTAKSETNDAATTNLFKSTLGSANKENTAVSQDSVKSALSEPLFKNDPGLSFASLAANSTAQPSTGFQTTSANFVGLKGNDDFSIFLTSGKDIKDKKLNASQESEGGAAGTTFEDTNYDPHYEPIIELPELIDVSTGEENEKKLFGERGILFRYDITNKEWKERGTGEVKILHHPEKGTYRLILRREQIHKLVLNHFIPDDFQLKPMNPAGKAFCWAALNYAEDTPELEKLAVRFKNPDIALRFEKEVEKCVEQVKQRGADLEED